MADKKPTYDELNGVWEEYQAYRVTVESMICIIGFFIYSLALSLIFVYAETGFTLSTRPDDYFATMFYLMLFVYLWVYGLWQFIVRIGYITSPLLEHAMNDVIHFIDKFFRAQAKAFASLDKDDEPKAVQTKLVEK